MVSKVEPGLSSSMDSKSERQECPPKFIESRKGKKLLVLNGYIFHLNTKKKTTGYFKCSQTYKGCGARIVLKNWNQKAYSFEGYEITNGIHLNHLPDFDKIKRKNTQVLSDKAQEDLNVPEYLNCKHVCLFCLSTLPPNLHLKSAILENVGSGSSDGKELEVILDNPTKNSQAFDLLCSLLNLKWRRNHEGRNFDQRIPLPLCLNCQNLYQEVFQLHIQIRELEILINKRVKVIRNLVEKSEDNNELTQLEYLGLNNFRRKVRDASFNLGCDSDEGPSKGNTATAAVTKTEPEVDGVPRNIPIAAEQLIKQEVNPEDEEHFKDSYYDTASMTWDGDTEENFDHNDDPQPSSPKYEEILSPSPPQRTRTTRLSAKRSIERITTSKKYNYSDEDIAVDDTDAKLSEDDNYDNDNTNSNLESDIQFTTAPKTTKKKRFPYRPKFNHPKNHKISKKPISPLTCHLCDATVTGGQRPFIQHYTDNHPTEKRFTCKFCHVHFRFIREVLDHQRRHTGERPFKCDKCLKSFVALKNLQSHQKYRHIKNLQTFLCLQCPKKFPTRNALSSHMYIHSEALSFCKTCGTSFRFKCQFTLHNQKVHNGTAELSPPIKDIENLEEILKELGIQPKVNKCHVCWKPVIGGKYFIQKHFDNCHPSHQGGLYSCQCGKKFINYWRTMEHAKRHDLERKEFQCDQCPHKSYSLAELGRHKETHVSMEERRGYHVCDKCGLGFASGLTLGQHKKKIHDEGEEEGDGRKKWICELCGNGFREKRGLDDHTKIIHLRILPWKCDKCGKAFGRRSILRRHEVVHLGYKKYKCGRCAGEEGKGEVAFVHKASLVRHMREVHEKGDEGRPKRGAVKSKNVTKILIHKSS